MKFQKKGFYVGFTIIVLVIFFSQALLVYPENHLLSAPVLLSPADSSVFSSNPGKLDWSDVENADKYSLLITYPDGTSKNFLVPEERLSPKKIDLYGFLVNLFRWLFRGSGATGYVTAENSILSELIISDESWEDMPEGKYSWNVVPIDISGKIGEFSKDFVFYKFKGDLKDLGWNTQGEARLNEINAVDSSIISAYNKLPVSEKMRQAKNKKNLADAYNGFTNNIDSRLLNSSFLATEGYYDDEGRIPAIVLFEIGKGLSDKSIAVKRNFQIINGASVYIKQSEIGRLVSSGNVRGIYLNEIVSIPKPAENEEEPLEDLSQDNRSLIINAPKAWEAGYKGDGVVVAILDTGIDKNHPDLIGKIIAEESFVGGNANDGHGHGTHVASLVAGTGAASQEKYQGVAPNAMLMNGKVLDNRGSGTLDGIIAGIEWAVNQNADIISMSLGGDLSNNLPDPLTEAANKAFDSGVVVVVAAGNSGWY